jgi:hypothetical protein
MKRKPVHRMRLVYFIPKKCLNLLSRLFIIRVSKHKKSLPATEFSFFKISHI